MSKLFKLTPEMLVAIVERVPEGFIHQNTLNKHFRPLGKKNASAPFSEAIEIGLYGKVGAYYFDAQRQTQQRVMAMSAWSDPIFPDKSRDGSLKERPIAERMAERQAQLEQADAPDHVRLVKAVEQSPYGFIQQDQLCTQPQDQAILDSLLDVHVLKRLDNLIYDPLQVGKRSAVKINHQAQLQTSIDKINDFLKSQPDSIYPLDELYQHFPPQTLDEALDIHGFKTFVIHVKHQKLDMQWAYPKGASLPEAREAAERAVRVPDSAWLPLLELVGDVLRPDAVEDDSNESKVIARSYSIKRGAKRLSLTPETIEHAVNDDLLIAFSDPEGKKRIPAYQIEQAIADDVYFEQIASYETIRTRDLAIVEGVNYATIRRRLRRMGLKYGDPQWGTVRGHWNLPTTYTTFLEKKNRLLEERKRQLEAERERKRQLAEAQREEERQARDELRQRLLDAFPAWRHAGRLDQHVSLHIGPPNSGKTHQSIEALVAAGNGWYLAPLRLLAFEIFDRLNQRGVPCNLLTGEEYIPMEGAQITAATIEMFNPSDSGDCIVIDEAQMLADTDRGWAWTRALMEAQAPEIHVIAPATARNLIVNLVTEAGIPNTIIEHERLAPIQVAEKATPLEKLKPRTILVAFSRRMVLHLKSELEHLKRSVSVVYGALPPEVRRKQADRFANGETEICIATDAVGMGLNLPADYVCFYEAEKYDGESIRPLNTSEVQQIGGRAGRFGYSQAGEVGAVHRRDLELIRKLFYAEPTDLTHAHVAPTVEDLQMIPGHLTQKFEQWRALDSIPETLRDSIKTTDLEERIQLAHMLSDEDVKALGLEGAVRLVNAPTRQQSRAYWLSCAKAIINERLMPLPPPAPAQIKNSRDLETTEIAIASADIYLWLASRREFQIYGGDQDAVRADREAWSTRIDEALLRKIDTTRRCSQCGKRLARNYRFGICESCFQRGHRWR